MKRFLTIFAAAAALLVAGCQKAEVVDTLNLSASTITVPSGGAQQSLTFNANGAWVLTCDQAWVEFDKKSGEAGDVSVKMTVKPNDTYSARSAKVTITIGQKNTEISIQQEEASSFGSTFVYKIDGEAQDIDVNVASSVDYTVTIEEGVNWLSVVKTKAAVTEGTIQIHVEANKGISVRRGSFTVSAGSYSQEFAVEQEVGYIDVTIASAVYVGNRDSIFDTETYQYNVFDEYVITLTAEDGSSVVVPVNVSGAGSNPQESIPTGAFVADASGKHQHRTSSIRPLGGAPLYYAKFVSGETETPIYDGEVNISSSSNGYSITTGLVDEAGNPRRIRYNGPIEITEDAAGLFISQPGIQGNYYTRNATNTYEWITSIYPNVLQPEDREIHVRSITLHLFGPAGVAPTGKGDLPTGTFTYGNPAPDAKYGKNGNIPNAANSFYFTAYIDKQNEDGYYILVDSVDTKSSPLPELVITKISDSIYSFSISGTIVYEVKHHDDESGTDVVDETYVLPVKYETDKAVIPDGSKGNYLWAPEPGEMNVDGSSPMLSYYWYLGGASAFGHAFLLPAVNFGTVTASIVLTTKTALTFDRATTVVPAGKYVYSTTPGDYVLVPARYSTTAKSYDEAPVTSSYARILDSYYEVTYFPTGGNIEVKADGTYIFDVECTSTGENPTTATLRGTTTLIPMMASMGMSSMDRSSWAGRFWFPPQAPATDPE